MLQGCGLCGGNFVVCPLLQIEDCLQITTFSSYFQQHDRPYHNFMVCPNRKLVTYNITVQNTLMASTFTQYIKHLWCVTESKISIINVQLTNLQRLHDAINQSFNQSTFICTALNHIQKHLKVLCIIRGNNKKVRPLTPCWKYATNKGKDLTFK